MRHDGRITKNAKKSLHQITKTEEFACEQPTWKLRGKDGDEPKTVAMMLYWQKPSYTDMPRTERQAFVLASAKCVTIKGFVPASQAKRTAGTKPGARSDRLSGSQACLPRPIWFLLLVNKTLVWRDDRPFGIPFRLGNPAPLPSRENSIVLNTTACAEHDGALGNSRSQTYISYDPIFPLFVLFTVPRPPKLFNCTILKHTTKPPCSPVVDHGFTCYASHFLANILHYIIFSRADRN